MLIDPETSAFLLIDVQEKLLPAVRESENLVAHCAWLLRLATAVQIPILASEQYPRGLGVTVAELRALLPPDALMEKLHFSCTAADSCQSKIIETGCHQVVLAGIEAHVCVLQTALGLVEQGKDVFVVADAVSSRHAQDMQLGLTRMRDVGVHIVSKEMVFFEWLKQAGTPEFKELSQAFLR